MITEGEIKMETEVKVKKKRKVTEKTPHLNKVKPISGYVAEQLGILGDMRIVAKGSDTAARMRNVLTNLNDQSRIDRALHALKLGDETPKQWLERYESYLTVKLPEKPKASI